MGVLSKVSMLLFTACFMQIPFREHLLVQAIQVSWPAGQALNTFPESLPMVSPRAGGNFQASQQSLWALGPVDCRQYRVHR